MRYTLERFQQDKAIEFGLNMNDLIILAWIIDFKDTDKMLKYPKNPEYVWVNYKTILKELPILGWNNTASVTRTIQKFIACGLAEKKVLRKKGILGTKVFIKFISDKMIQLIGSKPPDKNVEWLGQPPDKFIGCSDKPPDKNVGSDSTTNTSFDSTTKRIEHICEPNRFTPSQFVQWWNENKPKPLKKCLRTKPQKTFLAHIKSRLAEHPLRAEWDEAMDRIRASPFLLGESRNGWQTSIDFLVANPDNVMKILEGKYDKKEDQIEYY